MPCRCSSAVTGSTWHSPTRPILAALDEIKFAVGLTTEAITVEDDKLVKTIEKSLEEADGGLGDMEDDDFDDLDDLEVAEEGGESDQDDGDIDDAPG